MATSRGLVAILKNYQEADGSVTVPKGLRPYMGGEEFVQLRGAESMDCDRL